jgi:hypothetical protein
MNGEWEITKFEQVHRWNTYTAVLKDYRLLRYDWWWPLYVEEALAARNRPSEG